MNTTHTLRSSIVTLLIAIFFQTNILLLGVSASSNDGKIVYPIQEMSKLECRFEKFSNLSSNCKQQLPILNTKDYEKYAQQSGGYNDYTRIYTVLWGASYKYGWDVWFGWHQGTDIATAEWTPVYAMADGTVIIAKNMLGWWNNVSVEHVIDGKKIVSNYSHLSTIDTQVGSRVQAGQKIGEVGNTGNSFGNHLHFQIDLDTPFHPYYYDYTACPYSYNQITEQGVCFDELAANTIDPLAFLESNGAILDSIEYIQTPTTVTRSTTSEVTRGDIFDTTVYIWYNLQDIKQVQQIYKDLGYYNGAISGDYSDVEASVIAYQIERWVIEDKYSDGAGWFGPKTRTQTEIDYNAHLANTGTQQTNITSTVAETTPKTSYSNTTQVIKIERTNLLTREEIEAKELEEFMRDNDIIIKLQEVWGNIELWKTAILEVEVMTSRGRSYKGNIPASMTFETDDSIVDVFPKSLYNFNREAREIKITGKKVGNTNLKVKIGSKVVEVVPVKIYKSNQVISVESAKIYGWNSMVLGDTQSGFALLRDSAGQKLINIPYGSNFTLSTNDATQVCIKRWKLENIKQIYKTPCNPDNFTNDIVFSYSDTLDWVLVFDYKVSSGQAKITLTKNGGAQLSSKNIMVNNPKGLTAEYEYHDEVIALLEQGIVAGINQGYFLEKQGLTHNDALIWIENSLDATAAQTSSQSLKSEIAELKENLKQEQRSTFTMTRKEFLELSYTYLVFDKHNTQIDIKYRDLDTVENNMANLIFGNDQTWRDRFGDNYYRPDFSITRWEAAFVLSQAMQAPWNGTLVSR